jgi:DNA-binding GntR family transcriptional regulator
VVKSGGPTLRAPDLSLSAAPHAATTLNPIEPTNLRMMARAAIRAHIITGQLKAGAIYPVSYFATRLGVSATPVREALLDLASQGLVELARNKGFRVPELSEHELDEIYQLRLLIEAPAVVMAVGKLNTDDQHRCAELANKIEDCAAEGDLTGFLENDRLFHLALLEPIGNRRLLTIVDELRDGARLWALPSLARSEPLRSSAREHDQLLRAVVKGDIETARKIIVHHLEHTRGLWAGHTEG